jgi:hypothetical protein
MIIDKELKEYQKLKDRARKINKKLKKITIIVSTRIARTKKNDNKRK